MGVKVTVGVRDGVDVGVVVAEGVQEAVRVAVEVSVGVKVSVREGVPVGEGSGVAVGTLIVATRAAWVPTSAINSPACWVTRTTSVAPSSAAAWS